MQLYIFVQMGKKIIIKPHEGFQEKFVSSNVDIVIGGGILGAGKSSAAALMMADVLSDPNMKALFLRNNMGNIKAGGGLVDEISNFYGHICDIRFSGIPSAVFEEGARIDFNHTADQNPDVIMERIKGWQYDAIYLDELTGFKWSTFVLLMSRNRGSGKWTGKIRGTCNPKKTHWLRKYLDWYIGLDGYIIPERDGVVRFVYQMGETVDDLVWGMSKEEVYRKCKIAIDEAVRDQNVGGGSVKWEDLILSSVFYKGTLSENKAVLNRDRGYVGKIGMMGRKRAQQNLGGNWNVDPDLDEKLPISPEQAAAVFTNDHMINQEKWITADIADVGTNNMVVMVWNGFHVVDILVLSKTTPKDNASNILMMAEKHGVANTHIIYDATNARYISGYIEGSIPFISMNAPRGMYARSANRLKDECFLRLVSMINNDSITIDDSVAKRKYPIVNPNNHSITYTTVEREFVEECQVVQFEIMPTGKQRLLTKTEMKKKLGLGRSTDIIDTMAMRMCPVLELEYGSEFEATTKRYLGEHDYGDEKYRGETIYDILT